MDHPQKTSKIPTNQPTNQPKCTGNRSRGGGGWGGEGKQVFNLLFYANSYGHIRAMMGGRKRGASKTISHISPYSGAFSQQTAAMPYCQGLDVVHPMAHLGVAKGEVGLRAEVDPFAVGRSVHLQHPQRFFKHRSASL